MLGIEKYVAEASQRAHGMLSVKQQIDNLENVDELTKLRLYFAQCVLPEVIKEMIDGHYAYRIENQYNSNELDDPFDDGVFCRRRLKF